MADTAFEQDLHSSVHVNGTPAPAPAAAKAVVLAGGRGTRLAPYTSILPKPLMPIGERSILEIVVDQLRNCGFTDLTFCVGYLSHLIRAVFDCRAEDDVEIKYTHEEAPLGTAAPLRLIDDLNEPFIMMNGDVLTTLDYADFLRHHQASGNILTVATHRRTIKVDYGVLYLDDDSGDRVRAWAEKPEVPSIVSMGIYALEPAAVEYIPQDQYFDLPDLVQALLAAREPVGVYSHDGLWFDIGRHDDYEAAVAAWAEAGVTHNGHVSQLRVVA